MWQILFMNTPTGAMAIVDPRVPEDDIEEFGKENMTGIVISDGSMSVQSTQFSDLRAMAEAADAVTDRTEHRNAWKKVEEAANEISRTANRQNRQIALI